MKKYISFLLIGGLIIAKAQQSKADSFFEEDNFMEAAELYQKSYKDSRDKYSLEQLAIAYYNIQDYTRGLDVTTRLVNGDFAESDKVLKPKFHFLHAQFLSVNQQYDEVISHLNQYYQGINKPSLDEGKALQQLEGFRNNFPKFAVSELDINTDASEFSAFKVGDTIYFSSDRDGSTSNKTYQWTQRPFLDFWSVVVDKDNQSKSQPKLFAANLNTELHQGSFVFSPDGKQMYFTQSEIDDGKKIFREGKLNKVKLFKSTLQTEGTWSTPVRLSFCNDAANYEHPSISADGKTLYFASDRDGGFGSFDIYKTQILEDGSYTPVENLGEAVNTADREQFPFISDNERLYFASDGHLGLGLLDIYVSELDNGMFGSPINLGYPINTPYDDFSFTYSSRNKGFFSSNRNGKTDDIFQFESTSDLFSEMVDATITIKDKETGEAIPNVQIDIINSAGRIVQDEFMPNQSFFVSKFEQGNYRINVAAPSYVPVLKDVVFASDNKLIDILLEKSDDIVDVIRGKEKASQDVITKLVNDPNPPKIFAKDGVLYFDMPPIYFEFNKWYITDYSKKSLDLLASKMLQNPSLKVKVNAHTDTQGTEEYNQILSINRAMETVNYLIETGGVSKDRLTYEGFGERQPKVNCGENCTLKDHAANRRSEFAIIEY